MYTRGVAANTLSATARLEVAGVAFYREFRKEGTTREDAGRLLRQALEDQGFALVDTRDGEQVR